MANTNYTFVQTLPQVSLAAIGTLAQSFTVNLQGFDTLILDVAFTRVGGTALTFAFTGKSVNDTNDYGLTVTDYAAKTLSDASFTYTTSASVNKRFVFAIPALGVVPDAAGNITVTIGATGGSTDAALVTPIVARVA